MTTKLKRIIPKYYQDSRLIKLIIFGERLYLSCFKDFTIYMDFERLLYLIMPIEIYREYIEIMSNKLETYTSKFAAYSQFIIDNIEDNDDKNSN